MIVILGSAVIAIGIYYASINKEKIPLKIFNQSHNLSISIEKSL